MLQDSNVGSVSDRINSGWPHLLSVSARQINAVLVLRPPTHLYSLFVRSDYQRTGLARLLLHAADKLSIRDAGVRVQTVNSSLNAIAAYERIGFAVAASIQEVQGVRYQPMIRMNDG